MPSWQGSFSWTWDAISLSYPAFSNLFYSILPCYLQLVIVLPSVISSFIYQFLSAKYTSFMLRWDMELILHSCWRWNFIMITGIGQCYSWNCAQDWTDWVILHFQVIFRSNYGSIFLSPISQVFFLDSNTIKWDLIGMRLHFIWISGCFWSAFV